MARTTLFALAAAVVAVSLVHGADLTAWHNRFDAAVTSFNEAPSAAKLLDLHLAVHRARALSGSAPSAVKPTLDTMYAEIEREMAGLLELFANGHDITASVAALGARVDGYMLRLDAGAAPIHAARRLQSQEGEKLTWATLATWWRDHSPAKVIATGGAAGGDKLPVPLPEKPVLPAFEKGPSVGKFPVVNEKKVKFAGLCALFVKLGKDPPSYCDVEPPTPTPPVPSLAPPPPGIY